MTGRIFDYKPLLQELETKIIAAKPCEDGELLELESTIFFPRGGGQPCEAGTICGEPVLDVFDENGIIYHKVANVPFGEKAICKIDLEMRHENMRHHTAQHIISAVASGLFENNTIIARIEPSFAHIEFEKEMDYCQLAALKQECTKIIAQDLPIKCDYFEPEIAKTMDIRGKITPHEHIRVVEIENFDKNACGGTHCQSTGDVLDIQFIGLKHVRGAFRLYFAAGNHAVNFAKEQEIRSMEICDIMGTENPQEAQKAILEMKETAEKFAQENFALKNMLHECDGKLMGYEGKKIGEILFISKDFEGRNAKQLKVICENLLKAEKAVIMLTNTADGELSALFMQHKSLTVADFGTVLKEFLQNFDGKGGGSKIMAQGAVKYSEEAKIALDTLRDNVKSALEMAAEKH